MKKFEIDYWIEHPHIELDEETWETIIYRYQNEKLSAHRLSCEYGTTDDAIKKRLKARGIHVRDYSESQTSESVSAYLKDEKWLRQKYLEENLSTRQIAEIIGCNSSSVVRRLNSFGIREQSHRGRYKVNLRYDHSFIKSLRGFNTKVLNSVILKRDRFKCSLCGKSDTTLHVHHIRPLPEIINEILAEHPDLDPYDSDQAAQLFEIITKDSRFIDENNLITLCEGCHAYEHTH